MASTGVSGDVPSTLPPGDWTISFRLWYGSDAIQLVPVPGGTPREREEDPFTAACSTHINTEGVARVELHVAFLGSSCKIETLLDEGNSSSSGDADVSAYLSDDAGVIAELEPDVTTCWDYADAMMPPTG